VADGTIYLYFKNKDDILTQFYGHKTKQVFSKFREEVNTAQKAENKLKKLIWCHLKEFQHDKNMAYVYEAEIHQQFRLVEDQIKEMSKMYMDLITEIVQLGKIEGTMRQDLDIGLVKRFVLGAVDEEIRTWLHSKEEYDLCTMADPLVDLFIRGIGQK
jgi:TetR/AcrR family transcriptional regulator, fatty acid metabolism regulator protein